MKKLNLFFTLLIGLTVLSCSSDDNDCNNAIEPEGNEFTLNCERFDTPIGRLNINRSTEFETASCKLQFGNNHNGGNGTAFDYEENDNDINFVDIWIIIPSEYTLIDEIPTGTYTLENNLNSEINEQYAAFDITTSNRVIFNGSIVTYENINGLFFNPDRIYSEFNDIVVNVTKNGDIYTINYEMINNGKTIKGFYEGELEVVDNWL